MYIYMCDYIVCVGFIMFCCFFLFLVLDSMVHP